jgi:hypothetical protein
MDEKGKVQAILPIRAVREFLKRTYVILKENDPDSILALHMSGRNLMPMDAFCEIVIDGELANQYIQKQVAAGGPDNYFNILTLDIMRAEYMSHNWGPVAMFLPALVPGGGEKYHQDSPEVMAGIEHLIGMFLLHDAKMWPAWMNIKPLNDVWRAQTKFGWDEEVEFIPYWDKRIGEYVKIDSGGVQPVVCSIFKRKDQVMLVPFNDSDKDADLTIEIFPEKLGIPTAFKTIHDYFHGAFWYNIKDEKAIWKLRVRKRNFRMLVPRVM